MAQLEFYFAYGSNLCPVQMNERCPGSIFHAAGKIEGFRIDFPRLSKRWRAGVAGLSHEPAGIVEGAVYRISDRHLAILDELEGTAEGRYRRIEVNVSLVSGGRVRAHCYNALPEANGPFSPSADYLETMVRGARHHRLSAEWIDMLGGLRPHGPVAERLSR